MTDAGRHASPSRAEVPPLISDFAMWLGLVPATPASAFIAHHRPVEIHPFNDGNGRRARLLMNLILLRGGYPPVAVQREDRPVHVAAFQQPPTEHRPTAFDLLPYQQLNTTLDEYIAILRQGYLAAGPSCGRRLPGYPNNARTRRS